MTIDEIKSKLKAKGMTQTELANKLHIHRMSLYKILSGRAPLTETLSAHIELLLKEKQDQLLIYKVQLEDAVCEKWVPGWEYLTQKERKTAVEAVLQEALKQCVELGESIYTPEELAGLRRFADSLKVYDPKPIVLRDLADVTPETDFSDADEDELHGYDETMEPFA